MIVCKGLVKKYGFFTALDNVDLDLPAGKIVGLLGPNGSGKTTLIKIIAGLLTIDGGSVTVDGNEIGIKTKSVVSYLPERTYFSSSMTVKECIELFVDFYEDFDKEKAGEMLSALSIPEKAKFKTLSKGTKEKIQLIMVMSRKAKVYLLDEPIAGVDPAARDYILDTILTNYNPEATVIISTHLISDIENVLDNFVFISGGKIIEAGSVDEIRENKGMSLDEYFREMFKYRPRERAQGGNYVR